jgi:hypothetical protein
MCYVRETRETDKIASITRPQRAGGNFRITNPRTWSVQIFRINFFRHQTNTACRRCTELVWQAHSSDFATRRCYNSTCILKVSQSAESLSGSVAFASVQSLWPKQMPLIYTLYRGQFRSKMIAPII